MSKTVLSLDSCLMLNAFYAIGLAVPFTVISWFLLKKIRRVFGQQWDTLLPAEFVYCFRVSWSADLPKL